MKRYLQISFLTFILLMFVQIPSLYAQDWKAISKNLISNYNGKIQSIEQLNSSTCWAVLSPSLNNLECVKTAENIGYYIRNVTGGIRGKKPSVHVFKNNKHIAIARPSGLKYIGHLDIKIWNASSFRGKKKP